MKVKILADWKDQKSIDINDIFVINAVSCITTRKDKEEIIDMLLDNPISIDVEKEEAKNMVKSSLDRSKLTSIQQKVYDIIIND